MYVFENIFSKLPTVILHHYPYIIFGTYNNTI